MIHPLRYSRHRGRGHPQALTILPAVLSLHDVRDVEALARQTLHTQTQRYGSHLSDHQQEDAITYLIETTWELSQRYNPTTSSQSFSTYAGTILRRRVVDWYRQAGMGARYKTRPTFWNLEHRNPNQPAADWQTDTDFTITINR